MHRLLWLALAAGCTAPPLNEVGYLLLDRDTRAAGIEVAAGGWQGAPLLPLALAPRERVELVTRAGHLPLTLRAGALAWVRGGVVEWHPVDAERLMVRGSDAAAFALADALGAQVTAEDGRLVLHARELYHRASFMPAPDGVIETEPVTTRLPESTAAPTRATTPGAPLDTDALAPFTPELTDLVGLYREGARVLTLDASGGFSLIADCEVAMRGTWRRAGETVVIEPEGGAPLSLTLTSGSLRATGIELTRLQEDP